MAKSKTPKKTWKNSKEFKKEIKKLWEQHNKNPDSK
tara:strand:+ start:811 stop:918 length:108 start_codon:yes stop_codon:yes gene_type:complete